MLYNKIYIVESTTNYTRYKTLIFFLSSSIVVRLTSSELSSVGWTIYYIYRGLEFKPRSFHLSTLIVEFRATRQLDQKK
jgi:hypothetical protein